MIVVTTPTGKIGSQVVERLLAAGEAVRVVARDAGKLAPEVREKVDVVTGSIDDAAVMLAALEGAESVFLVVPPSFQSTDTRANYLQFTQPACRAIRQHGVKRAVAVSVLGRGIDVDAGPITASLLKDVEIEKTGVDFRALWCPGFMDNLMRDVKSINKFGRFFSPARPDVKMPRAATCDIAASGARLLLDRTWTGQGGLAVLGPEDLTNDEMAVIVSEVLGKPVHYQQVPAPAYKAELMTFGASPEFTDALLKMYEAKDNGLDCAEHRTAENTSPTSFRQWCEEVLKPAISAQ